MDFDFIVKKRKSVQSFKRTKASWKIVLEAIDAALQGPFASNNNNLKFLIVENKEKMKEIASICEQDWISEASLLVLVCSDDSLLEKVYGERGRVYSRQQAGAAVITLLFKLTELGLGSCWVGAYDDALIREKVGIPGHIQIEAMVPVGHSNDTSKKKKKKTLENVLYWERWGLNRRPTLFEEG